MHDPFEQSLRDMLNASPSSRRYSSICAKAADTDVPAVFGIWMKMQPMCGK